MSSKKPDGTIALFLKLLSIILFIVLAYAMIFHGGDTPAEALSTGIPEGPSITIDGYRHGGHAESPYIFHGTWRNAFDDNSLGLCAGSP